MLDPTHAAIVVARVAVDGGMSAHELVETIGSHLTEGARGVCLESRPGTVVEADLIAAAAGLTEVCVELEAVSSPTVAFDAGASGLLVDATEAHAVRRLALEHEATTWMTGVTAAPDPMQEAEGERMVLECDPARSGALVSSIAAMESASLRVSVGCGLPGAGSLLDGALEALTTIAVSGGARVLRCEDVRVVRRCADVAMELVLAAGALGEIPRDTTGAVS